MFKKRTTQIISKTVLFTLLLFTSTRQTTNFDVWQIFDQIHFEFSTTQTDINNINIVKSQIPKNITKKDWTIILYVAADNDLGAFAIRNIKQMAYVGSNEHFNIVVQLDIRKSTGEKITRRYYVKKGKVLHLNADDPDSQKMDSGDPETLVSCCGWAIENFPAEQFGLILWNHGTGILDPLRGRMIRPTELLSFNPQTNQVELDRSIGYLDRMLQRGICWDDTTGNYLNNQKLDYALDCVCKKYLNGEKFLFVGFDACLMQMIEVANIIKNYAHIMIGSQEAELGYGWNYANVLNPFKEGTIAPIDFVDHIIESYRVSYEKITNDYTLSALNLEVVGYLEQNVNDVAKLLIEGLIKQKNKTVTKYIKASRSRLVCTHFDEPSYIDLHHLYGNLLKNISHIKLTDKSLEKTFKNLLKEKLEEGQRLLESIVFSYTTGQSLSSARGLSIYFPERGMHPSYTKTNFVKNNQWGNFLAFYLSA